MHNELFTIGPFTVYGYGLMIAIGILAAYAMTEHLAKKRGLNPDRMFWLVIYAVVFGFAGAKILYIITRIPDLASDPAILEDLADGWVIYGGIIGGILGIRAAAYVYKEDFFDYLDIAAPAVALAQGFGRIGCFLAGCCYGIEYDGIFSVTFHTSEYAPNDVALLPTQLISSALDFAHFILLYQIFRKAKKRGLVIGTYLTCYSIGRFILEYFRGDLIRGTVGVFSTSQFISFFICAAGVIILFYMTKKGSMISYTGTAEQLQADTSEPQTDTEPQAAHAEVTADDSGCSEGL